MLKSFLVGLLLWASLSHASPEECEFDTAPVILEQGATETHQMWDFINFSIFWSEILPSGSEFTAFQNGIRNSLNIDPIAILEKQYPIFANSVNENMRLEGKNIRAVIDNNIDDIRPINCIEALLVEAQTKRLPLIEYPNEFMAAILTKAVNGRDLIRVYLSTSDKNFHKPRTDLFENDILKNDWEFLLFIHNHPFYLSKYPDGLYQGGVAPSINDVQFGRKHLVEDLKLKFLVVTNGFHSIWLNSNDLKHLHEPI